jgi:uncharacterized NAD(P)/FAD-binding protein YdhS
MTLVAVRTPTIAIAGGGFTGAAVAYHLAAEGVNARIVVIEPRSRLGAGLAYGGADPTHRVNVPAKRMSLLPDDENHFARWLETSGALAADPHAGSGDEVFPTRQTFGRYVHETLRPHVTEGRIVHVRDSIVSATWADAGWVLRTSRGEALRADLLVIATTHPKPDIPPPLDAFRGCARLVEDGLADHAIDAIATNDRVLIIGSGLTAADIVASLDGRGHKGRITMISRRGLRSQGHAPETFPPEGDFTSNPARAATRLLADIRESVRQAVAQGRTWHPVFDRLRAEGDRIWSALEPDARRRVVRHLRPFWDAHRFRVAPQIEAVLSRKLADGSLELLKARLGGAEQLENGFAIELLDRRRGLAFRRSFERVIVATGPAHTGILSAQPYLRELAEAGFVALDPTGLGLRTSRRGRALNARGEADSRLFVAGPLARGAFGELMGLPQVSAYARFIADELLSALSGVSTDETQSSVQSPKFGKAS